MKRTFIETKYFTRKWGELGFSDDNLRELQMHLLEYPKAGDLMKGTGGLRKLRFAFAHRGKSGSARVCYVDIEEKSTIHLIDVFAKNEKENLSPAERNKIRTLIEYIKKNG